MRIEINGISVITKESGEKKFYWISGDIVDIDNVPCESLRFRMAVPHKDGTIIDELEREGLERALEFINRSQDCLLKKMGH